jgi:hypothetical protein
VRIGRAHVLPVRAKRVVYQKPTMRSGPQHIL